MMLIATGAGYPASPWSTLLAGVVVVAVGGVVAAGAVAPVAGAFWATMTPGNDIDTIAVAATAI